jgi:hypothetical protein
MDESPEQVVCRLVMNAKGSEINIQDNALPGCAWFAVCSDTNYAG